jgi:hypothetical protein
MCKDVTGRARTYRDRVPRVADKAEDLSKGSDPRVATTALAVERADAAPSERIF